MFLWRASGGREGGVNTVLCTGMQRPRAIRVQHKEHGCQRVRAMVAWACLGHGVDSTPPAPAAAAAAPAATHPAISQARSCVSAVSIPAPGMQSAKHPPAAAAAATLTRFTQAVLLPGSVLFTTVFWRSQALHPLPPAAGPIACWHVMAAWGVRGAPLPGAVAVRVCYCLVWRLPACIAA